jgi:hypothetical protein
VTALSAAVKAALRDCGISQAGWARAQGFPDGKWYGDACGCSDDRCIGYHHDEDADCGCFSVLLTREMQVRAAGDRLPELRAAFPEWEIVPAWDGRWLAWLTTTPRNRPVVRVSGDTIEGLAAALNEYIAGDAGGTP